jgi:GT2 family glycosyltransferase
MLTRREVFQEVGRFDEGLMESLADIALCLKMQRAGYLIVTLLCKTLLARTTP